MIPAALKSAFDAAVAAGGSVKGTTSPNPPVGAAIVDKHGELVGIGSTQPPAERGVAREADVPAGAHAEVMALRAAGERARGGIAVVTLEPCNHFGRTPPCSHALAEAGISEVYYAVADPNPQARGGAEYLRSQGIKAIFLDEEVAELRPWLRSLQMGRPHITVKIAQTLDGYSAAADGSSKWITGEQARRAAHRDRARRDAIVVGTGTALADNPQLTARHADGSLRKHQPQRVVIGERALPEDLALSSPDVWRFADIDTALDQMWERGIRDVLVEGGPTLTSAFLDRGLVDSIQAYVSASLLGGGLRSIRLPDRHTSMADIKRMELVRVEQFGSDVLLEMALGSHADAAAENPSEEESEK